MSKKTVRFVFIFCFLGILTAAGALFAGNEAMLKADPGVWGSFFPEGLLNSEAQPVDVQSLNGKLVGVYFSAHWCPGCRDFTPKLVPFRNANQKEFEVVFVSSDKSEAEQFNYMKTYAMEWPTVKFGSATVKELKKKFGITRIPTLVILSTDGKTVTLEGKFDVETTPEAAIAKWKNGALRK